MLQYVKCLAQSNAMESPELDPTLETDGFSNFCIESLHVLLLLLFCSAGIACL